MQPPGLKSDSGIENLSGSSGLGSSADEYSGMGQKLKRNGGHFLKPSGFRITLCTIGKEGNCDKIGQLFDSVKSQKTVKTVSVPGVIN
ncbi:MAG: hypothetical protein EZS28_030624 [Streblomastix strix]|uniref:Uncharacterized protein n=1 Tax=Streblomastix strix TaxID=222440 RepID=A0A5J4UVG6_9EUKA|nr:MAG: hypothetical protein EZS28_030624 [Streblomastix strix]